MFCVLVRSKAGRTLPPEACSGGDNLSPSGPHLGLQPKPDSGEAALYPAPPPWPGTASAPGISIAGTQEVLGNVRHVAPPWGLWCRLWGNNWLSGSGCGLCCLPELDFLRSKLLKCPLVETWISSTVRSSCVATET